MQQFSTPQRRNTARLLVLCAALLWSTSGVFARAPVFDSWSPTARGPLLAFWRAAFAGLMLLPTVRRPRWHWMLVPVLAAFAVMNLTFLTAMVRTSPANAIWLQNAAPFWVFLLAIFVFGEQIVPRDLIPLAFGLFGVGAILACETSSTTSYDAWGLGAGLLSGVAYAVVLSVLGRLSFLDTAWVVALCQVASATLLFPWIVAVGIWPSYPQMLALAAFGVIQIGIPYVLVMRAMRYIGAQETVGIALIEPVLVPVWVYLVWGVTTPLWTIVGAALILTGLVLRYFIFQERGNGS